MQDSSVVPSKEGKNDNYPIQFRAIDLEAAKKQIAIELKLIKIKQ